MCVDSVKSTPSVPPSASVGPSIRPDSEMRHLHVSQSVSQSVSQVHCTVIERTEARLFKRASIFLSLSLSLSSDFWLPPGNCHGARLGTTDDDNDDDDDAILF